MADELITQSHALSVGAQSPAPIQMTNHGKGTMIGVANNPTITVNNNPMTQEMFNEFLMTFMSQHLASGALKLQCPQSPEPFQEVSHAVEWAALRTDCFNLFVLRVCL